MTDKPASPFARLDTSLLRSTRAPAPPPAETLTDPPEQAESTAPAKPRSTRPRRLKPDNNLASQHAMPVASDSDSNMDSTIASMLARRPDPVIETIRKIVKTPGREVSFVRLTPDEKGRLVDLVYAFKRRGRRTTENEINRIAVNLILEDYAVNGEDSVIARVIDALLA